MTIKLSPQYYISLLVWLLIVFKTSRCLQPVPCQLCLCSRHQSTDCWHTKYSSPGLCWRSPGSPYPNRENNAFADIPEERLDEIRKATLCDASLQTVVQLVLKGWLLDRNTIPSCALSYFHLCDSITVMDGIVVKEKISWFMHNLPRSEATKHSIATKTTQRWWWAMAENWYLIVEGYYSTFIEAYLLTTLTSTCVITLKKRSLVWHTKNDSVRSRPTVYQ